MSEAARPLNLTNPLTNRNQNQQVYVYCVGDPMPPSSRWLNFAGAAVMLGAVGGLGALAWGVLRTSGDGDEALINESSPSPTIVTATPVPPAVATSTQTPNPTVAPAPVPVDMAAYQAIFVRKPAPLDGLAGGEIWIASFGGSDRRRLTAEGESATLAGLATHPSTGGQAVYFVSLDGGSARTVWAIDIKTGERLNLFTFESVREDYADASVSPNGRYVAYAHPTGIDYIDLANGQTRHLLDNDPRECDASNCLAHSRPQWSPDGTLLMVRRGFWEGGTTVILDPFGAEPVPITNDSSDGPSSAYWSADGQSACGHTGYGESYLNVANRPDWIFSRVPGYEQADWSGALIASCEWIARELLVFTANVSRPDTDGNIVPEYSVELLAYDRTLGSARVITTFDQGIQIVSAGLHALPTSRWVVTQNSITEPGAADSHLSQPEVIDVDTGAGTPVLEPSDWVVKVLRP